MKPELTESAAVTHWHEGQIPAFVGPALDALYGSLYSSLPQLLLGDLHQVSTYVARVHDRLKALFLFTLRGSAARVVNEGMQVTAADAERFAVQLFERYPALTRIDFHAIDCMGELSAMPSRRFEVDEDIVIDLPATETEYLGRLGKSTRKTLRQNLARAQGLTHRVLSGAVVDAALVDRIIGFNHARLAAKQRQSAIDRNAAQKLYTLVRTQGIVGTVHMHGQLCAGTLASRIGDDVYSLVNAHDPAFDSLGMGTLCRHLMIVAAIRSGARRFHLMGGNFADKRLCGAKRQVLQHLVIYRDRWRMLVDLPHLGSLAWHAQRYRLGTALEDGSINPQLAGTARAMAGLARTLRSALRSGMAALRGTRAMR